MKSILVLILLLGATMSDAALYSSNTTPSANNYVVKAFTTGSNPSTEFRHNGVVVLLIKANGDIEWRGRRIESDDDFRAAMIDLSKLMAEITEGRCK